MESKKLWPYVHRKYYVQTCSNIYTQDYKYTYVSCSINPVKFTIFSTMTKVFPRNINRVIFLGPLWRVVGPSVGPLSTFPYKAISSLSFHPNLLKFGTHVP